MNDFLTLSDILGRVHSVQWHEAVALVRGVAERLYEGAGEAVLVPELHQIEISPSGHVGVSGGAIADEPVRHLGQLLHAVLGGSELPVQLRLAMVQATAPTPAYGSIREYDEALAYFERPTRGAVLAALYARAAAVPSDPQSKLARLDTLAPLPAPERRENTAKREKSNPRTLRLVVGGALVVIACAGGLYYATTAGAVAGNTSVSAIAAKASDAVTAAATAGLSAVTERAGLGRLVPDDTADEVVTGAPAGEPTERSRAARRPVLDDQLAQVAVFDLDPVQADGAEPPAFLDLTSERDALLRELAAAGIQNDADLIFSSDSVGVSPPVGVRPQLPRELPSYLRPEQLTRFDLVVSETGAVESIKLVGSPRTVHDSMLLSAAKAWQFQPALKDGHPVRYRKTIWFATQ
jgi:hypothetical protein